MTGNEKRKGISLVNSTGWNVNPSTGIISLSDETLQQIINPDPIEKWYTIDQEPLARGQFAVVYHCYHKITGVEYAAKFSSRWRFGTDCKEYLLHEISVCALLQSQPRAVQLIDVFSTASEVVLVMEYAPGGDLQTLLDEELVPYEHDVVSFIRQLLEVLVVIHDSNLVHLDIKPQNLVLMGEFPECEVKLCDFEISRMLSKGHEIREILGTPDYVAPEILHYEPITVSTDMWSVGVLTYVLLTGFLPFGGENDQETFMEISRCELDFPSQLFEDITPDAIDFIEKLLIRQPERRISAKESLMHPWIRRSIKRPTPPNTLALSHINTPAMDIIEKSGIPNGLRFNAERSLSCPVSEKFEENKKDVETNQYIRSTPYQFKPQKSLQESTLMVSTPVSTPSTLLSSPFFPKSDMRASRQNLERLKSMSKSREVLSGKIQMSNLKKCQSKSRERIIEAKLGFSKSHEQLMALRSLSQSVEALSVLSRLQANNLGSSCCNIFNYIEKPNVIQERRMYQSLASIDQIDKARKVNNNQYDSTVSLNTEIYNDLLTQRNTDINCKLDVYKENSKYPQRLKPNVIKGGRTACGIQCSKYKKEESNTSQRINKSDKQKKEVSKDKKSSNKPDRIREKRRRSSVASESDNVLKTMNKNTNVSSAPIRRRSVSHVEQRLKERHERQQERKRKEKISIRRRSTPECERNNDYLSKSKLSKSADKIITSKIKNNTKENKKRISSTSSPFSSDVSQSSSLESVEQSISNPTSPNQDIFIVPIVTVTSDYEMYNVNVDNSSAIKCTHNLGYSINEKLDNELDKTPLHLNGNEDLQEKQNISVSDRIKIFEKVTQPCKNRQFCLNIQSHNNFGGQRLGIINEEDNMSEKSDSKIDLSRTTSSSSEIESLSSSSGEVENIKNREVNRFSGNNELQFNKLKNSEIETDNIVSEISNLNIKTKQLEKLSSDNIKIENLYIKPDSISPKSCQESNFSDGILNKKGKNRSRSFSVHSTTIDATKTLGRSRSKSFNLNNPPGMPWGSICNGAVARAFEKFNLTEDDISPCSSPRNLSPTLLFPVS